MALLTAYRSESEPCCILLYSIPSHTCPRLALSSRKETDCARCTFSVSFFYEG